MVNTPHSQFPFQLIVPPFLPSLRFTLFRDRGRRGIWSCRTMVSIQESTELTGLCKREHDAPARRADSPLNSKPFTTNLETMLNAPSTHSCNFLRHRSRSEFESKCEKGIPGSRRAGPSKLSQTRVRVPFLPTAFFSSITAFTFVRQRRRFDSIAVTLWLTTLWIKGEPTIGIGTNRAVVATRELSTAPHEFKGRKEGCHTATRRLPSGLLTALRNEKSLSHL